MPLTWISRPVFPNMRSNGWTHEWIGVGLGDGYAILKGTKTRHPQIAINIPDTRGQTNFYGYMHRERGVFRGREHMLDKVIHNRSGLPQDVVELARKMRQAIGMGLLRDMSRDLMDDTQDDDDD